MQLGQLCRARARLLREELKDREAAELMLDTAQYGRDLAHNGLLITEMVGHAVLGTAFEELAEILRDGRLSKPQHAQVAEELAILDASFAGASSILNEAAANGMTLLHEPGSGLEEYHLGPRHTWRHGFSIRGLAADAVPRVESAARRLAAAEARPWAEALKVLRELTVETRASKNVIATIVVSRLTGHRETARERRAQLRMLRIAAHWRATGGVLTLDDPFGTNLRHSASSAGLKVWSLGSDSVDSGGTGSWNPGQRGDMVLEIAP